MNRLAGKVVLITGASAGIGAATANEFAKVGCHLVITARRLEKLQALKTHIQSNFPESKVHCVKLDVTNEAQVKSLVTDLPADLRNVDVLVNNAGLVVGMDTMENVSTAAFTLMFDTNVKGLLWVTQAVLPGMKARNSGHVINISSISGKEVYPGGGPYCATKHAVMALTNTLRLELLDSNLRVTSILPGLVETEFSLVRFSGDQDRAKKVYEGLDPLHAQDVAETVVFSANRPPHVQIADITVFCTKQAGATTVARSK